MLRPDLLAPVTQFTEASQISDPNPGPVPGIGPDLMENAKNAVRDMVDWLVVDQQRACTRPTPCAAWPAT